jgi:hypothetical protein
MIRGHGQRLQFMLTLGTMASVKPDQALDMTMQFNLETADGNGYSYAATDLQSRIC